MGRWRKIPITLIEVLAAPVRVNDLLRVGRNHFPQLFNSRLKGALLALVVLVSLRHTGQLRLQHLQPRYGFDYEGDAHTGDEVAIVFHTVRVVDSASYTTAFRL